jgi:Na+-driven multidrug efflux pump
MTLYVAVVLTFLVSGNAFQFQQRTQRIIPHFPPWRKGKSVREVAMSLGDEETKLDDFDDLIKRDAKNEIEGIIRYPPTPTLRECFSFALPALGIYACPPLMSLIDASFIGRTSSVELAALGPAGSISDCSPLPLLFLSIAATNLVAKAYAKKDDASCARISRTSLGLGTVIGTILAAVLYQMAGPISFLYCGGGSAATRATAETLAPLCAKYVAIRAIALPSVVIATISQAVCIGSKDTRTPMIAVALAGGLNFFGDLVLVNYLGMGIAGAAWATTLSQFAAAGLLLRVLQKRGFLRRGGPVAVNGLSNNDSKQTVDTTTEGGEDTSTRATIMSLLSFVPFLFVMGVKIGMHNSCAATAASLGGAPAAAHTALFAVAMLCFTFGDVGSSLSQAFLPAFVATSPLGSSNSNVPSFDIMAATPTIKQLLKCTFTISATVVCLSSALLTIFSGQITRDPAVIQQMRAVLPLMIATLSIHGTVVTLEGLLLARKNFRALSITYTGVAVSVAALLALVRRSGVGLLGIWGCYIWFQGSRLVAFSAFGGLLGNPLRWWRRRLLYSFIRKNAKAQQVVNGD